jgi:hypothetical protein
MRFQDPIPVTLGGISDQEPVMLFRAQDKHALMALEAYLDAVKDDPEVSGELVVAVRDQIARFQNWRNDYDVKTPDMPVGSRVNLDA